jgi:hypothetical protein
MVELHEWKETKITFQVLLLDVPPQLSLLMDVGILLTGRTQDFYTQACVTASMSAPLETCTSKS